MKERTAKAAVKFMRRDSQIKFNESQQKREREVEKVNAFRFSAHTHTQSDPILIGIRRLAMRENIVHVIVAATVLLHKRYHDLTPNRISVCIGRTELWFIHWGRESWAKQRLALRNLVRKLRSGAKVLKPHLSLDYNY